MEDDVMLDDQTCYIQMILTLDFPPSYNTGHNSLEIFSFGDNIIHATQIFSK